VFERSGWRRIKKKEGGGVFRQRGGAEQSVQQGVGQLCQSPVSLPASLTTVLRLGGGAGGGSALTCSNL